MALPEIGLSPEVNLVTLAAGAVGVFLLLFLLYLLLEGDADMAAQKTGRRARGATIGILGVAIAAIAELLHLLSEVPSLVIGAIGVGAIMQGWNWDVFLAVAVLAWIVLEAVDRLAGVRRA